tara:strand:+ start:248 stop:541 length:294 start_codon:yes stop_codon:yes gene_type:complete
MNDPNLEIFLVKTDINKLIEEIKYKHLQKDGTYKLTEKSKEWLDILKRTLELINHLYDFCCKQNTDLSTEKLQNLKNFRVIAELKNDIKKLEKLSKF